MGIDSPWDEAQCHLLASAMSSHLREHILKTARAQNVSDENFRFISLQDETMSLEMESLRPHAPALIVKQKDGIPDTVGEYAVSDMIVQALEAMQWEAKLDLAECGRRLEKRRRFLKSMLLFDIVGSVTEVSPVMKLSSNPGFSVAIDDIWDDNSKALVRVTGDDSEYEAFTISLRTLLTLRKIVQPVAEARCATFDFNTTGSCEMHLPNTRPALLFLQKYPDVLGGA